MISQKEINLLPGKKESLNKRQLTAISVLAFIMLSGALSYWGYFQPANEIKRLKLDNMAVMEEINSIGDMNERAKKLQDKQSELQAKRDSLDAIKKDKVNIRFYLEKIRSILPERVYVSTLSVGNGDSINASFVTSDPVDTVRIFVKLRELELFENVDISSVPIEKKEATIGFNLKIKGKKVQGQDSKEQKPNNGADEAQSKGNAVKEEGKK